VLCLHGESAKFNRMKCHAIYSVLGALMLVFLGHTTPALARAPFSLCHQGGGVNCVVDGDTVWLAGEKIRVADIDAPETHPARCPREAELGRAATLRLQALLNSGPVQLGTIKRDQDRYGRKLRLLLRDGQSLGMVLVREGLARPYQGGRRQPWCPAQ
jgi:endonuclease YncB( thermonuclease family)